MGLLDRVRSRLAALFGSREEDEAEQAATGDDEPRLDPDNVTEVRKQAEDDPAAKLSEVRTAQESEDDPEESEEHA